MDKNAQRDIAIIGGGIGGLTAALAFARQNARVTIYEQAPALTEVGAGLQITPNGARVLNALGLEKALAASGITAQAVAPMDAITGKQITRFDLSAQTPAYRFYHQHHAPRPSQSYAWQPDHQRLVRRREHAQHPLGWGQYHR